MRVNIAMGMAAGVPCQETAADMDLEELLATRLLVQGNSGSGKSHLLRRLLEQSADRVQQCVIDPEGDFITLADEFGHLVVEADRTAEELMRIAVRIRKHRVSCVLNLEGLEADNQMRAASAFLTGLFEAERDYWYPMLVVVDEAQLFAPSGAVEVSEEARRRSLSAMTNLMCRGRKRGLAGVIATQRLAKLAKNVAAEASNFFMGRTFLDIDMARAADLLGMERRQAEMFRDLKRGHFIALGPALSRRPLPIKIGSVATAARSGSPKLLPLPQTPQDAAQLIFTPPSAAELAAEKNSVAKPAAAPAKPTEDILRELVKKQAAAKQAEGAESETEAGITSPEICEQERRQLLASVAAEIWADSRAAYQPAAVLYQDFQLRCRIHRLKGGVPDLRAFRRLWAFAQAEAGSDAEQSPLWSDACRLSEQLSDDVQGIFLRLAAAAIKGEPCPPDAVLARIRGTQSHSRARSILTMFEKRGMIVVRTDFGGKRIIIFPDLGVETAPGNPDAVISDAPEAVKSALSVDSDAETVKTEKEPDLLNL